MQKKKKKYKNIYVLVEFSEYSNKKWTLLGFKQMEKFYEPENEKMLLESLFWEYAIYRVLGSTDPQSEF